MSGLSAAPRKTSQLSAKARSKAKAASASSGLLPTAPVASLEAAAADPNNDDDDDDDMLSQFPREALDDAQVLIDPGKTIDMDVDDESDMQAPESAAGFSFAPLKTHRTASNTTSTRKVTVAPNRLTPLKRDWMELYTPLVEECGLQVRMNPKKRCVELKTSKHTPEPAGTILQKAVDFLQAYNTGFNAEDAIALLRMDSLYIESFQVKDVKPLHGDHLSRAIGRIAGHNGKTRFTIENATRTRIVLADDKISILGTFEGIRMARDAVCRLIMGSPPGKVYNSLKVVAARARGRY